MLLEPSLLRHLAFFPLCFGLPPLHHFVTRLSNSQAPLFTHTPSVLCTFHTVVPLNGVSSVCPHSKNPKGNYRVVIHLPLEVVSVLLLFASDTPTPQLPPLFSLSAHSADKGAADCADV